MVAAEVVAAQCACCGSAGRAAELCEGGWTVTTGTAGGVAVIAGSNLTDGDGDMADLGDPAAECGYFASGGAAGGGAGA